MQLTLALALAPALLIGFVVLCLLVFLAILIAPSRRVRDEPPLDPDVEAKLLLHRDPDEPTGEVSSAEVRDLIDRRGPLPDGTEELPAVDDLSALADLDGDERA